MLISIFIEVFVVGKSLSQTAISFCAYFRSGSDRELLSYSRVPLKVIWNFCKDTK